MGTNRRVSIEETLGLASEEMGLSRDAWRRLSAMQWALLRTARILAVDAESRVGGGR
jgi:hypothetical protein